jgi:hypothetical protein
MRQALVNTNPDLTAANNKYIMRITGDALRDFINNTLLTRLKALTGGFLNCTIEHLHKQAKTEAD